MSRQIYAYFLFSIIFFLLPQSLLAAKSAYTVTQLESVYSVLDDGTVTAIQDIVVDISSGEDNTVAPFYFFVPTGYSIGSGSIEIQNVRVYDPSGQILSSDLYEAYSGLDRFVFVLMPPSGEKEYRWRIEYDIFRAVEHKKSADFFATTILPTDSDYGVESFTLRMIFPDGLDEQLSLHRGRLHSLESVNIDVVDTEYRARIEKIDPDEGIWLEASWRSNVLPLPEPSLPSRIWFFLRIPYYGLPIIVALFLALVFFRYGRDPRLHGRQQIRQTPPKNLSPGHLGALVHERVRIVYLIAMVVDLARRGYIRVIEEERQSPLSKKDYTFIKMREVNTHSHLHPIERYFLESLFAVGRLQGSGRKTERVKMSTLKNHFASRISRMREMMMNDLVEEKYFRQHPNATRHKYIMIAILTCIIALPVWLVGGIIFQNIFSGIPILLTGGLFFLFSPFMPQKTAKGAAAHEWAEGFKRFLHHPERYVEKELSADQFSRYLPYAMIFGVERAWASAFDSILTEAPDWFIPSGEFTSFSATEFAHSLRGSFAHAASQNLYAVSSNDSGMDMTME